jgi:hypothetical protein
VVPADPTQWIVAAAEHRFEDHLGRPSLYLRDGLATVADTHFLNGVIELDMAVDGARGFPGVVWRAQGDEDFEWFFVRPHRTGDLDASQYTPVFHGIPGWQLYHGRPYTAPVPIPVEEWFRIRIVVSDAVAEVFVVDMTTPLLVIDELKRAVEPGAIGLLAGGDPGAHVSDFGFETVSSPPIRRSVAAAEAVADGVVRTWWVSDPFPEEGLASRVSLSGEDVAGRPASRLDAEPSGLADLARVSGITDGKNTVFARTIVRADRDLIKRLDFGFSDRVRVYLNGHLLFSGDDTYQSRDHRFLGSIGFFDALYLPLVGGRNELTLAVTEVDLGGWGVQARFEDLAGIVLEGPDELR